MVGKLIIGLVVLAALASCSGGESDPTINAPAMSAKEEAKARADTMTDEQRKMLDSRPR